MKVGESGLTTFLAISSDIRRNLRTAFILGRSVSDRIVAGLRSHLDVLGLVLCLLHTFKVL